jgi:hypothetical protein
MNCSCYAETVRDEFSSTAFVVGARFGVKLAFTH